jgi:hypothetical protein
VCSVENRSLTYDVTLASRGVHQLVEIPAPAAGQKRVIAVEAADDLDLIAY